jgi:hypothetical protein
MENFKEYKVLTLQDSKQLSGAVENYLQQGYTLIGGISTVELGGIIHYTQAVAK